MVMIVARLTVVQFWVVFHRGGAATSCMGGRGIPTALPWHGMAIDPSCKIPFCQNLVQLVASLAH